MKNLKEKGWVRIWRKIEDNPVWFLESFTKAQAWIDLLIFANHKTNSISIRGNILQIKRGQVAWSELTMAKRWTWSKNKVRRFLKWLEMEHQIEQQKSHLTSLITIKNYEDYQSDDTTDDTTERQQKDNRRYTNNNDNNVKNDNNITNVIVKQKYGNPLINDLTGYFLTRMSLPKEDCSQRQSRQYWNLLLKESKTGINGVKWLIDLASQDQFYKSNITSSKDLYYKRIKIISRKRGEKDGSRVSIDIAKI